MDIRAGCPCQNACLYSIWIVYFLSSLRGQTAKTLICTKSGVSADSRKSAEKCAKSAEKKSAQKVRFSALFAHFSALFLESAETPLFVQINVFAVWPLRLDRKYTVFGGPDRSFWRDVHSDIRPKPSSLGWLFAPDWQAAVSVAMSARLSPNIGIQHECARSKQHCTKSVLDTLVAYQRRSLGTCPDALSDALILWEGCKP